MGQLNVTNPFDGSPVGEVQLSSESDVDLALTIAERHIRPIERGFQDTKEPPF
jgi:acyl-CoA reductase-like NAD-dependent aldehyde dehydrogenase